MTTLKGIFTTPKAPERNFLTENKKKIRQMSAKLNKQPVTPPIKTASVPQRTGSRQTINYDPPVGVEYPVHRTHLFIKCRNQACQTEEEGIDNASQDNLDMPSTNSPTPSLEKTENKPIADQSEEKSALPKTSCTSGKKKNPRNGKKEIIIKEDVNLESPPGHTTLSEKDRLDMLDKLLSAQNSRIQELNRLPVGSDTLRIRNRKIEIEKLLHDIEEGIRIFSRTKVYIALDE